jgi:hypothetical protein
MGEERGNREEKLGRRSMVVLEYWKEWSGAERHAILLGRGEHSG